MMYLLLRDNKQSGPYAFEELKTKGLKPYDLVWVEGRSAAWRYPSEIDELRAFAPAVEEQPFDRFFKKPGSVKTAASAPAADSQPVSANPPVSKRNIYVTMPGSTGARESFREPSLVPGATPAREAAREPEASGQPSPIITAMEKRVMDGQAVEERFIAASAVEERSMGRQAVGQRKDVAPSPDVSKVRGRANHSPQTGRARPEYRSSRAEYSGEPVVEILSPLPRRKANRAGQVALVSLAALVLLAAGIFIGISIRRDHTRIDQFASKSATDNTQPNRSLAQQLPVQHPATDPANQPVSNQNSNTAGASAPGASGNPSAAQSEGPATPKRDVATGSAGVARATSGGGTGIGQQPDRLAALTAGQAAGKSRRPSRQKTETTNVASALPSAADTGVGQPLVIHREAAHRPDVVEKVQAANDRESARVALANLVSVGANRFEVGTFGGIRNLQVTVSNRSAFALDLVVVEISYVQANKKIYKTENLYFRDIGAGSALMLEAPKTSRGINIQYKITSINSRQLGLSQPGT